MDELEAAFTYQRPILEQVDQMTTIREKAKELARLIFELCPPSADRTAAIRKVREGVMTANAAIVLGPIPRT